MDWLIVLVIVGVGIACLFNNQAWGRSMQEYYIRESKKHWYGRLFPWGNPWTIVIFRGMFIGLGIMLIIIAYPLVFGPFYS
jgi:hypothetical protein